MLTYTIYHIIRLRKKVNGNRSLSRLKNKFNRHGHIDFTCGVVPLRIYIIILLYIFPFVWPTLLYYLKITRRDESINKIIYE